MKVRAAKLIAKGERITKIVILDDNGVTGAENHLPKTWYEYGTSRHNDGQPEDKGYFEQGVWTEEVKTLSDVLKNADWVFEIHTAAGPVWTSEVQTLTEIYGTGNMD